MPYSRKLVDLIEQNADSLSTKCVAWVKSDPCTPTYRAYDAERLYERAYRVYSQLGTWISDDVSKDDIERVYTELGEKRFREGFSVSEVIQALLITRRVLWEAIQAEGLLDTALELHVALDLQDKIVRFFDRALFALALGYERAEVESDGDSPSLFDSVQLP